MLLSVGSPEERSLPKPDNRDDRPRRRAFLSEVTERVSIDSSDNQELNGGGGRATNKADRFAFDRRHPAHERSLATEIGNDS